MITVLLEIVAFLAFIISCLYLPGKFLIHKLKLKVTSPADIFMATGFGFMLFTLIAYIFSWIRLDILILPFFLVLSLLAIKDKQWRPEKITKEHIKPLILVGVLALLFSSYMLVTGKWGDTIVYRHDDIWHLSLINELKTHFPPDFPSLAGTPLTGYHFFYNFVAAKISNIFLISPLSLHFHLFPLFLAFMWGIGVYSLVFVWTKKIDASLWAVFLSLFGGSAAFILLLQGHPNISLDSGLGILQPANALYNPPFASSVVTVIIALFALHQYLTTKQKGWLVPLVLCIGLAAMFKVYAGMLLVGGFMLLTLFSLLQRRFIILVALLVVGALFYGTYEVFNAHAGYLIWHPWWPPHVLLQGFDWYGYDEKIYTYTKLGVIKGLVETESYGFSLFLFGNLGTRLIGLLVLFALLIKKPKLPSVFATIVAAMGLAALMIPLLFFQSGKVFEIIQMAMFYLFFFSLFAAIGLSKLFSFSYPKIVKVVLFLIIILLTLPSAYDTFRQSYYLLTMDVRQNMNTAYYQTLAYLSRQETYDATVLELPPPEINADDWSLNGWYYAKDASVVAFANKRSYFNNTFQLMPDAVLKQRFEFLKEIVAFSKGNTQPLPPGVLQEEVTNGLQKNNIHYIFTPYDATKLTTIHGITEVYRNGSYRIYKVAEK